MWLVVFLEDLTSSISSSRSLDTLWFSLGFPEQKKYNHGSQIFERIKTTIPKEPEVYYRIVHENRRFFEVYEIPRTDGSLILMNFFFQLVLGTNGSLFPNYFKNTTLEMIYYYYYFYFFCTGVGRDDSTFTWVR